MSIGALPKVIVDAAAAALIQDANFFGASTAGHVLLFQSDTVPNEANVLADFQEADFDGYARFELDGSAWDLSQDTDAGITMFNEVVADFTAGAGLAGPQTIYGFLLANVDDDTLFGAVRFDEPIVVSQVGQHVMVIPMISVRPAIGRASPMDTA